jgi:hypothetical protein
MSETFLTPDDLAKRWKVSLRTLEDRRTNGDGPPYIRLGAGPRARVRYRLSDIEAYESADKTQPTEPEHARHDP